MTARLASDSSVRELSTDEQGFFRDNGWAHLPRLIAPDRSADLLEQAKRVMGPHGEAFTPRPGVDAAVEWSSHYHWAALEDMRPFSDIALCPEIGRAAQQLAGRDVPMRYYRDMIAVRHPVGRGAKDKPTPAHQDYPSRLFDRMGYINLWIALNEIPPERGSMQFLSKAQREGPLGWDNKDVAGETLDLAQAYPWLEERYRWSEPLTLAPGDATCHGMLTVHRAGVNSTDEPRWAYIVTYIPDDVRYVGNPEVPQMTMGYPPHLQGLGPETAVPPGSRFDHPRFPVVYPPGVVRGER
jgi:hypothetical protein